MTVPPTYESPYLVCFALPMETKTPVDSTLSLRMMYYLLLGGQSQCRFKAYHFFKLMTNPTEMESQISGQAPKPLMTLSKFAHMKCLSSDS